MLHPRMDDIPHRYQAIYKIVHYHHPDIFLTSCSYHLFHSFFTNVNYELVLATTAESLHIKKYKWEKQAKYPQWFFMR